MFANSGSDRQARVADAFDQVSTGLLPARSRTRSPDESYAPRSGARQGLEFMPIRGHNGSVQPVGQGQGTTIRKRNTALHRFDPTDCPPEFRIKVTPLADADCQEFGYGRLGPIRPRHPEEIVIHLAEIDGMDVSCAPCIE